MRQLEKVGGGVVEHNTAEHKKKDSDISLKLSTPLHIYRVVKKNKQASH